MRYRRQGRIGEAVYTPTSALPLEMLRFYLEAILIASATCSWLWIGGTLE